MTDFIPYLLLLLSAPLTYALGRMHERRLLRKNKESRAAILREIKKLDQQCKEAAS